MVARALILAAGKGASIGGDAELSNCLTTVGRCSVIERTLELLEDLGVARIGITVGFAGAAVRKHIAASTVLSAATKRRVTFFENADWQGPNGLSVLAARSFVTERTLLLMADQIAAPGLVREIASHTGGGRSHGAGRRSRSVARVRHRRRHQGEAGRRARRGDRQAVDQL